jgi:hypothetical protein
MPPHRKLVSPMAGKQAIRERIWRLLERRRAGRFPFPLAGIVWSELSEAQRREIPALGALGR